MAMNIHKVDIFLDNRPLTWETIFLIEEFTGPFSDVNVHNIMDPGELERAERYSVNSIPAIVVDGKPVNIQYFLERMRKVSDDSKRSAATSKGYMGPDSISNN